MINLTYTKYLRLVYHTKPNRKQEALLSQRGRAMLRVCIVSIQNVERSLLLLVVSASDIPLRTIKFFYVVFSSAYWSMLQAITNIRWCVADCAIYTASSSSFLTCNSLLRRAIRRHHPPQRAVLGQICCFGERKVVLFQILLDGGEPRDAGTT